MRKIILSAVIGISACAAPPEVADQSSKVLDGNCKKLFLDSSVYRYQHVANVFTGRAVFALSKSLDGQYCAYATNQHWDVKEHSLEVLAPWEKLEIVAIARCENIKPAGAPPCKVFARNNEIIWDRKSKTTLD